jgi:hypothetical protein
MARQEGGQCSIGAVKARTAWLAGAAGAAIAAWHKLRRPQPLPPPPAPVEDPRAEELRQKLEESRAVVDAPEEFDSAETTVDQAEPVDVTDRRSAVHERGRAAAEEMRRQSGQ